MEYFFSGHVFKRMKERGLSPVVIRSIVETGTIIQEYPNDKPYPSWLILGFCENRPIHVVAAYDADEDKEYIITAYEPDTKLWSEGFTKRR